MYDFRIIAALVMIFLAEGSFFKSVLFDYFCFVHSLYDMLSHKRAIFYRHLFPQISLTKKFKYYSAVSSKFLLKETIY